MSAQIDKLKAEGLVTDEQLSKMSAQQKEALEKLSESEIATLKQVRAKAGGASDTSEVSGTYPL